MDQHHQSLHSRSVPQLGLSCWCVGGTGNAPCWIYLEESSNSIYLESMKYNQPQLQGKGGFREGDGTKCSIRQVGRKWRNLENKKPIHLEFDAFSVHVSGIILLILWEGPMIHLSICSFPCTLIIIFLFFSSCSCWVSLADTFGVLFEWKGMPEGLL